MNKKRLDALGRKLRRNVHRCEVCGAELDNQQFFINYTDRHTALPHQMTVVCQKHFRQGN